MEASGSDAAYGTQTLFLEDNFKPSEQSLVNTSFMEWTRRYQSILESKEPKNPFEEEEAGCDGGIVLSVYRFNMTSRDVGYLLRTHMQDRLSRLFKPSNNHSFVLIQVGQMILEETMRTWEER